MKIAFIANWFPGLSETFILNQVTGLIDRGHDVAIFANGPSKQPMTHADFKRYRLAERTFYYGDTYVHFPDNKIDRVKKAVLLAGHRAGERSIQPLLRAMNPFKYGKQAVALTLFFKAMAFLDRDADEYDIFHCHFGSNGNLAVFLKEIGIIKGKIVTTFHGYDLTKYLQETNTHVYDPLFQVGDLFLPISNRWRQKLVELGCSQEKILVHRMGVDTGKFDFSVREPKRSGAIQLLSIARLVEKKGIEYAIRAVSQLAQKYPQIEYKVVGDGPLKDKLAVLIKSLGVDRQIKLLGWKPHEEVVDLVRQADVLLAPSVTAADGDQEGIPVVLMEALAQGLPVLSTQHSGIPELIQDGVSGLLVPERDVAALAEKLEHLFHHPELWPELSRAGRSQVEKNYDIHCLNDRLVEIYTELLNDKVVALDSGKFPISSF